MSKRRNKEKLKFNFDEAKKLFPHIRKIYSGIKDKRMFESYLITKEDEIKKLLYSNKEIMANSFHVIVVVDLKNYSDIGTVVYDFDKYIDWNKIEYKNRHCNPCSLYPKYGNELCTHIPEQAKEMDNPLLENLKTAYAMYVAYNKLLNGEPYVLKGYSHGDKGRQEYEQERKERK